jgi:hypothetical protein
MKWMMTYMIELEGGVLPGKPVEALSARRRILSGHFDPAFGKYEGAQAKNVVYYPRNE